MKVLFSSENYDILLIILHYINKLYEIAIFSWLRILSKAYNITNILKYQLEKNLIRLSKPGLI